MIIRIVKLHFDEKYIGDFLTHFETVKFDVANFKGCYGMKLLRDVNDSNLVMTYSHWESEKDLDNYRNSELFGEIWPTIKKWFDQKPEAWSVEVYFDGFQ